MEAALAKTGRFMVEKLLGNQSGSGRTPPSKGAEGLPGGSGRAGPGGVPGGGPGSKKPFWGPENVSGCGAHLCE